MAGIQNFRISVRGFNRKDVVDYIEYINNKHNAQIEQLNNQLQEALSKSGDEELQEKLRAAEARIQELEAAGTQPAVANCTEQELEAYRRAESAERQAKERAQQICDQANAVLADVTAKVQNACAEVTAIADQMQDAKAAIENAVATLSAIDSKN